MTMDALGKIGEKNGESGASEGWAEGYARLVRCMKLQLRPGEALQVQMFMDLSVFELFFVDGQVLSIRVYRGESGILEGFLRGRGA